MADQWELDLNEVADEIKAIIARNIDESSAWQSKYHASRSELAQAEATIDALTAELADLTGKDQVRPTPPIQKRSLFKR